MYKSYIKCIHCVIMSRITLGAVTSQTVGIVPKIHTANDLATHTQEARTQIKHVTDMPWRQHSMNDRWAPENTYCNCLAALVV